MIYASTFLMRDGRVANLDAHLTRLREETAFNPHIVEHVREELRDAGPGIFRPLIRVGKTTVTVDLQPSMMPAEEITVDAEGIIDLRRHPTRKGPDFGWQIRQLNMLRHSGSDAGLLIDERGNVISGVFSAVLFLQEGTVNISAHPRASDSVTLDAALEMLTEEGLRVIEHPEGLTMTQLRGNETWLLSSVEGVRKVTGWLEYGSVLPPRISNPPRMGAPTHREINQRMWELAGEV
ncbi:aminotransferase class IV [Corynebacterium comes]|uniref:Aminotransferase class IV n=1 Tax=Corynebacterium comes TaxID=2675218 RepID=A0A6B8VWC6_9CORY|nr:aminotransferase class IV [Corynebacterium comes]QGU03987.1 Aminotransferase class IV [Corynebacterium comes]